MTYARARLWLGITSVGFWVLLASLLLVFNIPTQLSGYSYPALLILTVCLYVVLSAPLDIIGGYILPKRYGRSELTLSTWLKQWIKGVLTQSVVIIVLSMAIWPLLSQTSMLVKTIAVTLAQLLLAVLQPYVAQWVGSITPIHKTNSTTWQSTDIGFTGGISITGTNMMPEQWYKQLSENQYTMVAKRRQYLASTMMNYLGGLLAIGFNTAGFVAVCTLFNLSFQSPSEWLILVSGFTLWSFMGALLLPGISQNAVLKLDAIAWSNTIEDSAEELEQLILQLDKWQDEEPERNRWIQTLFHPLPSAKQRCIALKNTSPNSTRHLAFWHAARRALYYSWALGNPLCRAVHCNIGRPDLWVYLPSES